MSYEAAMGTAPGKRTAEEHQEESVIQQQQRVAASSSGSWVPWLLLGAGVLGGVGLVVYLGRRKP